MFFVVKCVILGSFMFSTPKKGSNVLLQYHISLELVFIEVI